MPLCKGGAQRRDEPFSVEWFLVKFRGHFGSKSVGVSLQWTARCVCGRKTLFGRCGVVGATEIEGCGVVFAGNGAVEDVVRV